MTETEMEIIFDKACSNYSDRALESILYEKLIETGAGQPTETDLEFAENIWNTFSESEQENSLNLMRGFGYYGDGSEFEGKYLCDNILPYIHLIRYYLFLPTYPM